MLTLARVLVAEPRLLIADELSLGLAPIVTEEVYRILGQVRAAGTALLIVEQHLDHALGIADQVVVLDTGETRFSGPAAELGDRASGFLSTEQETPVNTSESAHRDDGHPVTGGQR